MIKKLIFYNNHNNGDIHYAREFIKDIIKKTSYDEYHFLSMRSHKLLMDIPVLQFGGLNDNCRIDSHYHVVNNETYINTHLEGMFDIFYEKIKDVNLPVFYNYFRVIFHKLQIKIESNREYYVPEINYDVFENNGIKEYIEKNKNVKVLICNGDVQSSQSFPVDFKEIVERLSNDFKDIDFILTDKKDLFEKENVLYTTDIIKASPSDLNEISYLSTFCSMIIGRASGPYCFTQVKKNMDDPDKTYVFLCNLFSDGMWYERNLCSKIWINNNDVNNIFEIVSDELKKLKNCKNLFDVSSKDNKIIIVPLEDSPKIRVEFYKDQEILYKYQVDFIKGNSHWVVPHGHYQTGVKVRCKFFNDETNEYLFEKVV